MSTLSTSAVRKAVSIQDFVSGLRQIPARDFDRVEAVLEYVERTPVLPETLARYLKWDRQHYTRNLIDKTPLFELLAICWEPGQVSSVHNHRDQNCWMAVPIGRLMVGNYHLVCQDIEGGTCRLEMKDTVEMNPERPCAVDPADPVHKVYNPREFGERAVSLHVYSRPFDSCVVYSPEQGTCGEIKLQYTTQFGVPAAQ